MAILLLFILTVFIAYTVRNTILKLKAVDKNIEKLVAIQKAQELIDEERKRIRK